MKMIISLNMLLLASSFATAMELSERGMKELMLPKSQELRFELSLLYVISIISPSCEVRATYTKQSNFHDGRLKIWNAKTGKLITVISQHRDYHFPREPISIGFRGDKALEITNKKGEIVGELLLDENYEYNEGNYLDPLYPQYAYSSEPDSRWMKSCSEKKKQTAGTSQELQEELMSSPFLIALMSPSGTVRATYSEQGQYRSEKHLKLWDVKTGELISTVELHDYNLPREIKTLKFINNRTIEIEGSYEQVSTIHLDSNYQSYRARD